MKGTSDISKAFQGNFNGNVVFNLIINRPADHRIGFFGGTYIGEIKNLGIENYKIIGKDYVGGLIGQNGGAAFSGCNINNCYVIGKIEGVGSRISGLAGVHRGNTFMNCYSIGKVKGVEYIGGLVSNSSDNALIINCFSTNSVEDSNIVSGLLGKNGGEIRNCIAVNDSVVLYSSSSNIDRISDNGTYILRNNYARNDMVVQNALRDVPITDGLNTKDGKGVAMELLQRFDFYATGSNWYNNEAWDILTSLEYQIVWRICDGEGLPFLHWQKKECETFYYYCHYRRAWDPAGGGYGKHVKFAKRHYCRNTHGKCFKCAKSKY